MSKKIILSAICIFALLVNNPYVFSQQDWLPQLDAQLKDGFRNIKWGTPLSEMQAMNLKFDVKSTEGIDVYRKDNDDLTYLDIPLEKINYGFYENGFCSVFLEINNKPLWDKMKKILSEKYGKPLDVFEGKDEKSEEYIWQGDVSSIQMSYAKDISRGGVVFSYFFWLKQNKP